jgi:anti-sigma factor ChrR (cupin superfamily)
MRSKLIASLAIALGTTAALAVHAASTVETPASLEWKELGIPGVAAAPVSGNMDKGPSRFFLKYPKGFVTPRHHHSADHSVVVISGTITLTVGGKDHDLGPGSYFELTEKAAHVARVKGEQEAVFFVEAEGPWDVVVEK